MSFLKTFKRPEGAARSDRWHDMVTERNDRRQFFNHSSSSNGTQEVSAASPTVHNNNGHPQAHPRQPNPSSSRTNTSIQMTGIMPFTNNIPDPESNRETGELAIEVINLQYRNRAPRLSLRGINLTLPKGKIYAIVDPTGHGSEKLIQCILGSEQRKRGVVRVFGQLPGTPGASVPGRRVGYMPASDALYPELSVLGNLLFFGRLHGMSDGRIKERIKVLTKILMLPSATVSVGVLWPDQRKRVSLAAALIHSPPLLILRSPYSDMELLFQNPVWEHLKSLSRDEGVSILFTTPDSEGAFRADIVSFMMFGCLTAQSSPEQLLNDFGCDSLRDVHPKLFRGDEWMEEISRLIVKNENDHTYSTVTRGQEETSVRGIDPKSTPRNPIPGLIRGLIGRERSSDSPYLISTLLRKDLALMRRNRPLYAVLIYTLQFAVAYLWFFIGFDSMGSRGALEDPLTNSTHLRSFVEDVPREDIIENILEERPILLSWRGRITKILCEALLYGSAGKPDSIQILQSAIVLPITSYATMLFMAFAIIGEFKAGTAQRCLRSGVQLHAIILSRVLSQLVLLLAHVAWLMVLLRYPLRIPLSGAISLFPLIFLQGVRGITQGLVMSSCCMLRDFQEVYAILPLFLIVSCDLLLSGEVIPPEWISKLLISTSPAVAFGAILDRGWGVDEEVLLGCFSNILWSGLFLLIAVFVWRCSRYQTLV